MPKNLRGGKGSKKGKNSGDTRDVAGKFPDRVEGQMYGRVTKALGNRRMICFCNDGIDRVCKIRASLCYSKSGKGQRIFIGDIVLLSFRESGDDSGSEADIDGGESKVAVLASGRKEVGDILFKYHRDHWKLIKQDGVIHKNLLLVTCAGGEEEEDIFEDGGDDCDAEMGDAEIAAI